ncbi:flippase-like domain-containing protein [Candidatus Saccharibacteria bacterium]|nr:flippase-like domain-containing protein [Candidatus Saccharibacteria bacterium]
MTVTSALKKLFRSTSKKLGRLKKYFANQTRDTRYVFVFIFALAVLIISTLQALDAGLFDSLERPLFDAVNNLPTFLDSTMYAITQLGGVGALFLWVGIAWFFINRRAALTVAGTGIFAWNIARLMKTLVARGRPEELLDSLRLFGDEKFGGYGFPSGHSTFVAACVTVLYFQLDRAYRKYLLLAVFAVGFSRMYLGAHFPLDVIGGWALGALLGATVCLLFGVSVQSLTIRQIKTALRKKGYKMRHIQLADVDARGSRPYFLTGLEGQKYFAKIFGVQEHAADWLFKTYRFFRFKNLQAEEPFISSRRNIEMESLATLWARNAGVRVPVIVDLVKVRSSWMLIQEKIEATSLSSHGKLLQKSLVDAWSQVNLMHESNMAHRDLRAANLMIDKQGQAWIIDFGFAEVSPRKQRQHMDIAELLMSMSLVVGVERTVDAAMEVVDPERMTRVLPYLKREVFSGATAKSLKSHKSLLEDLKTEIKDRLAIEEDLDDADIIRINRRKVFNVVLVGVLLYVIIPQFNLFRGALGSLSSLNAAWLVPILISSAVTYILAAIVFVILSSVPLQVIQTTIAQLAASFMSKIIPGGVGSASLNARYLYRAGNDRADSAAILAAGNVIGFAMFIVPLSIFLLFKGESISSVIAINITLRQAVIAVILLLVAIFILAMNKKIKRKVVSAVSSFATSIREFTNSPFEVALACASALAFSLAYVVCLYACFKAFGLNLGFAEAVLVYASAVIAKSVVPTPGGLGPLEIAMVSAMLGLGTAKPEALSVVVLYRLATFWLPIPFSLIAYQYMSRKRLI